MTLNGELMFDVIRKGVNPLFVLGLVISIYADSAFEWSPLRYGPLYVGTEDM